MIGLLLNFIMFLLRLMPLVVFFIALYRNPWHLRLKKAGCKEKDAAVGNVRFHYAETVGSSGPDLLLLHGHQLDWFSYHRVIAALSGHYHVYAVDIPGHGQTRYPDDYEMSAESIGTSIAEFIEQVTGGPVIISGNDTGGLAAVWLAAHRADLVRAVILEDTPLFSSEYPAVRRTAAYRTYELCEKALRHDTEGDFLLFWLRNSKEFSFRPARALLSLLIFLTRMLHWQKIVEIPFVSPLLKERVRGMDQYDPRYGQAFYEGTWNDHFEHAEALCRIQCPVLLIQADSAVLPDGTLEGAMSEQNVQFACSRLQNVTTIHINAGHVIHLEAPEEYLKAACGFIDRVTGADKNSPEKNS